MHGIGSFLVTIVSGCLVIAPPAVSRSETATIESGAIELGLAGGFQSVEGSRTLSTAFALSRYVGGGEQRLFVKAITEYTHVGELDAGEFAMAGGLLLRTFDSPAHPYAGVRFGVQQEWLGSFSQVRYPVGIEVGVKVLTSRGAALTMAYEYRRMLSDPIASYNEHRFVLGVSVLFRNGGTQR